MKTGLLAVMLFCLPVTLNDDPNWLKFDLSWLRPLGPIAGGK
jgi:hypothetical protein